MCGANISECYLGSRSFNDCFKTFPSSVPRLVNRDDDDVHSVFVSVCVYVFTVSSREHSTVSPVCVCVRVCVERHCEQ